MLIGVKREQCCVIDGQNGDFPTFCAILSVVSILLDKKTCKGLGEDINRNLQLNKTDTLLQYYCCHSVQLCKSTIVFWYKKKEAHSFMD